MSILQTERPDPDPTTERCEHCKAYGTLCGGIPCHLCGGNGRVPKGTLCTCFGCRVDREMVHR